MHYVIAVNNPITNVNNAASDWWMTRHFNWEDVMLLKGKSWQDVKISGAHVSSLFLHNRRWMASQTAQDEKAARKKIYLYLTVQHQR